VPKVIYDALRQAGALVQTHVEKLEAELGRVVQRGVGGRSPRNGEKMWIMKEIDGKINKKNGKNYAVRLKNHAFLKNHAVFALKPCCFCQVLRMLFGAC